MPARPRRRSTSPPLLVGDHSILVRVTAWCRLRHSENAYEKAYYKAPNYRDRSCCERRRRLRATSWFSCSNFSKHGVNQHVSIACPIKWGTCVCDGADSSDENSEVYLT